MRSDIIPPNRAITIALLLGLLALIVWGAYSRDPATIVIIVALAIFFGLPALLLFTFNRRAHPQAPPPPDEADRP